MAYSVVTSGGAVGSIDGATTGSLDTTGATLLVLCVVYSDGVAAPAIADSRGNTWVPLTPVTDSGHVTQLYYVTNPFADSGHTFSATGTSCAASLSVIALTSGAGVSTVDVNFTSVTADTGALSSTHADEIAVKCVGVATTQTPPTVAGSGYTLFNSGLDAGGDGFGIASAYKILAATGTVRGNWSGGSVGQYTGVVVGSWYLVASADTPISGDSAAIAVAGSSALLSMGESGAAAAIAVAGSSALLSMGESGAAAAIAVAGSSALLSMGPSAGSRAVSIASSSAALRLGSSAGLGAVSIASSSAALRLGSSAGPGAVSIASSSAALDRSGPSPAAAVMLVGAPATLVALSPPGPPLPPPPPPAPSSGRPGRRRRRGGTQVYGSIPSDLGSGPTLPSGG